MPLTDIKAVSEYARRMVSESPNRMTPVALENAMAHRFAIQEQSGSPRR